MDINFYELLKDCPKGTKLYSPLFGEVEFERILYSVYELPIEVTNEHGESIYFSIDGEENSYFNTEECMLFPSKENRDWSKWQCPKNRFDPKTLKPFDRVLVRYSHTEWICTFLSHTKYNDHKLRHVTINGSYEYCIPYNEETKHLVGTNNEAPEYYRYWED